MTDANTMPADDWWKPDADDPFWMLEASDGEWLKNEQSLMGTREAAKALRFPSAQSAMNTRALWAGGSKWWDAKPTEHLWCNMPSAPPSPDAGEREAVARAICVSMYGADIWDSAEGDDRKAILSDADAAISALSSIRTTERATEYARGLADGVKQGEAATVAWLRSLPHYANLANQIERREHAQEAGNER